MTSTSAARRFSEQPLTGLRIALGVDYDGSAYHGWQVQRQIQQEGDSVKTNVPTVQGALQRALSFVAAESVTVYCAGRTDAGVHATNQVVHFEPGVIRSEKAWLLGTNTNLPRDIAVKWVCAVDDDFHARFSATARTYRYVINNTHTRPALAATQLTWITDPLDAALMHEEAQCLLGENDFSSFRGAGCQSNTPYRYVNHVRVWRHGQLVCIEICANAFLLHMVRNIVGVLTAVGRGEKPQGWTREVLAMKDRTKAGVTAPPNGLYLVGVSYPERFGLPKTPPGPIFLPYSSTP
jgi:tRNA pseudouridine38-40 synthase